MKSSTIAGNQPAENTNHMLILFEFYILYLIIQLAWEMYMKIREMTKYVKLIFIFLNKIILIS